MAVTVTPTLFGSYTPQLVSIAVAGLLTTDTVSVWREPAGAGRQAVRGGTARKPASDALTLVDTEAPMGRPVLYVASVTHADGTVEEVSGGPVTLTDAGRHVLSDPYTGRPVLVDVVLTPDEREQAATAATMRPRGRRFPVVVSDVRAADAGELVVYVRDQAEHAQLVDLLAAGTAVVSRHPADDCDIAAVEVLAIGDVRTRRRSRAGDRLVTLPFQAVQTPDPSLVLELVTLGHLAAFYVNRTLLDIAGDYSTLLEIAQDDFGALS